jgi:hypothetical protein
MSHPGPDIRASDRSGEDNAKSLWLAFLPAIAFLAAAIPLIALNCGGGRAAADQAEFHLPTIRQFAAQLPAPGLRNYPSATTPGYHLSLAAACRYLSSDERFLRLTGCLFTVALLLVLPLHLQRSTGPLAAACLTLPLAASLYVFGSGAWLTPDNAGWLGVLAVLAIALRRPFDGRAVILGGAALLALVLVRQIHLWAAVPLWAAAMANEQYPPLPVLRERAGVRAWPERPFGRTLLCLAATLPAFVVVVIFCWLWGGSVPPQFQSAHQNFNPAAPAMILATFCLPALALAPCLAILSLPSFGSGTVAGVRAWPAAWRRWLLAGLIVGLLAGLLPQTSYNYAAGRFSGLWNLVPRFPIFAERSPLMIALATLGGGLLALYLAALPRRRDTWIILAALLAFTAAHTVGAFAWQRYYEPLALVLLPLLVSRIADHDIPRRALAGPLALSVLLTVVTVLSLR